MRLFEVSWLCLFNSILEKIQVLSVFVTKFPLTSVDSEFNSYLITALSGLCLLSGAPFAMYCYGVSGFSLLTSEFVCRSHTAQRVFAGNTCSESELASERCMQR